MRALKSQSICLSVYLSVCLSVCLSICLSVYLSVCLSVCLSICLSVYLSICLSICLSVYLSVCLSVCLSVYLTVCLSVYPSIHPSNFVTAVAVFQKPNVIPLCFFNDMVPNFLLSWLLVLRLISEAWFRFFFSISCFLTTSEEMARCIKPNLEDQVIFGQCFLLLAFDK